MTIRYLNILKCIEIEEKRKKARKNKNQFRFLIIMSIFTLSSLLMMFWAKFSKNEVFLCAALLILIFVYLSFIVAPFFYCTKIEVK